MKHARKAFICGKSFESRSASQRYFRVANNIKMQRSLESLTPELYLARVLIFQGMTSQKDERWLNLMNAKRLIEYAMEQEKNNA